MSKERLLEEKHELIHTWEECFGIKITDKFTQSAIDYMLEDEVSLSEVNMMLTSAAIIMALTPGEDPQFDVYDGDSGRWAHYGAHKPQKYAVECTTTKHTFSERFETKAGAEEYAKDIALNSRHMLSELKVVQVD